MEVAIFEVRLLWWKRKNIFLILARLILSITLGVIAMTGTAGTAQTIKITGYDSSYNNMGNLSSAVTGDTIYRIDPATGGTTKISGNGVRAGTSPVRQILLLTCLYGTTNSCLAASTTVTIYSSTSVGRARALTNLTAVKGPSSFTMGTVSGTSTQISFTVTNIGLNATVQIYIGGDFKWAGDDSGIPTGAASASIGAQVASDPGDSFANISAQIYKPISVTKNSDLAFGTVTKPTSGSGSVVVNASTNLRTVTGTGVIGMGTPAPGRAGFDVVGEASRAVFVSIPTSFDMTGPGGATRTVTTSNVGGGVQTLSASGTLSVYVGGSLPLTSTAATALGAYNGSFTVTVYYN